MIEIATQTVLKYSSMIAIQYSSTGLVNIKYRCDYTGIHAGQVTLLPARDSPPVVFKQSKCKDVLSQCNERSLSNVTWHLILTCQNEFTDNSPDSPVPNKATVSRLANCFHGTGSVQDTTVFVRHPALRDSSLDEILQALFCCPHCILFSDLNVIYFLTERTCLVWVA
jgi:hypothetical protein